MKTEQILFKLLRFGLDKNPPSKEQLEEIKQSLSEDKLKRLFVLAKKHDLSYCVCKALIDCGLVKEEDEAYNGLLKEINLCIYRHENQNYQYERIKQTLLDNNIDFIPLKGAIIREFYPQGAQRSSCDVDILVKTSQVEQAVDLLCQQLGYTSDKKRGFHDYNISAPEVNIELHFSLRENLKNIDGVLDGVWDYASKVGNTCEYSLSNEFFLFHIVAHASYHFLGGGCGIKPIVDLFVLKDKLNIDEKTFGKLLEETSLTTFYNGLKQLVEVWFYDEQANQLCEKMTDYILRGGVYGVKENAIVINQAKSGGRHSYIFSRLFLPYDLLCIRYPILRKHKWLYPFCQIARWFKLLFSKKLKNAKKEVKINSAITDKQRESAQGLLKELGL